MNDTPPPVTTADLATLDRDLGRDGVSIIRSLAGLLRDAGRVSDTDVFVDAVLAREALGSTVLPGGVAMPHARSHATVAPSIAVARLPEPVPFTAGADPVRLVLLVAAPGDDSEGYLALLRKLATACVRHAFIADLGEAGSAPELAALVSAAVDKR